MRVKWKCLWNVVKYYLAGLAGAIVLLLGVVWIVANWYTYIPVPALNESAVNTTMYSTVYSGGGCGCGISTSIVPLGLIFFGCLGLAYFFYQDIKPCIIWSEK